jgi:ATP-binding cassette subfamily F protein 3
MSLLSAINLAKSFGPVDIFSDISLDIPHEARISVVGPNGIGKTTLLRILLGFEEASGGIVKRARDLNVGYLPQEAGLAGQHTLWEECLTAVAGLRALESRLAELEVAMGNSDLAGAALELDESNFRQELEKDPSFQDRRRRAMAGFAKAADMPGRRRIAFGWGRLHTNLDNSLHKHHYVGS